MTQLASNGHASDPPTKRNQRASRRTSPKNSTKARAFRNHLGLGPNIGIKLLDISENGLRVILKEDLPVGREFEIMLETPCKSVKVHGQVVWTVPTADGKFVIGAKFTKSLAYADLHHLARM
ncbi:MAG: PilZ domain-containing protein [Gemmataceae bacterium]